MLKFEYGKGCTIFNDGTIKEMINGWTPRNLNWKSWKRKISGSGMGRSGRIPVWITLCFSTNGRRLSWKIPGTT